jgi:tetratricopeptide (TPR) repeat protein
VRQPNGEHLPVAVSVRLTASELKLEETADVAERGRAIFRKIPPGPVHLRVAAEGFAPTELDSVLDSTGRTKRVLVHLRALVKDRAPGGSWVPALPSRDAVLYSKTLESLRTKKVSEAEKHFEKLFRNAPGHPNVNYLGGVLAYRRNDMNEAAMYFYKAAYLNPESEDAARALGGILYRGGEYRGALQAFSMLTRMRPDSWEAEWAAASAALRAGAYESAREHALRAAKHKVRPEPILLLALSDSLLRNADESVQAARDFLAVARDSPLAPTAHALIAAKDRPENIILEAPPPVSLEQAQSALVSDDLIEPRLPSRLWAPPDVDDSAPVLAPNAVCSELEVLPPVSREVARMAGGIGEVGADEEISQEEVDGLGHGRHVVHINTDYEAEIHTLRTGQLSVSEYRARSMPEAERGSPPVVHGLVALALVFHPLYLEDFTFRCEGLTEWKGQESWSIHFVQKQDRPGRLHVFVDAGNTYTGYLRGRALVDKLTFEVLHLETDLLEPIPPLHLDQEHLAVDYGPVTFQLSKRRFWLPEQADLYVHLYGRQYHVRHTLRSYITFTVDTREEFRLPKEAQAPPPPTSNPETKPQP